MTAQGHRAAAPSQPSSRSPAMGHSGTTSSKRYTTNDRTATPLCAIHESEIYTIRSLRTAILLLHTCGRWSRRVLTCGCLRCFAHAYATHGRSGFHRGCHGPAGPVTQSAPAQPECNLRWVAMRHSASADWGLARSRRFGWRMPPTRRAALPRQQWRRAPAQQRRRCPPAV